MKLSLLVAAGLLLLHAAFVAYGPRSGEPRFQNQEQQNRYIIERFFAQPAAQDVVYVGSSMAARLSLGGTPPCTYNLALHGESSLSGLAVATLRKARPRLVFIEINVPERKPNLALIDKANGPLARHFSLFGVENMPVNMLFTYLSRLKGNGNGTPTLDARLLANGLTTERDVYSHEIPRSLLSENMLILKDQVDGLKAAGTRVVFFELPIHPSLEQTPRALQIRAAFATTFPTDRMIASTELSRGISIQTIDGVHLAPSEAAAVEMALQTYAGGACLRSPAELPE
jgi:hypothetical protein